MNNILSYSILFMFKNKKKKLKSSVKKLLIQKKTIYVKFLNTF